MKGEKVKAVLRGFIFLLVFVVVGPARAQQALIGYWPFDGSGTDLSSGGRNLDLFGGVGFAQGLFSHALDSPGNPSQYAARPQDDPIFDFGAADFTLQVWVRFDQTWGEQTLLEKFSFGGGPGWTVTKLRGNSLQFFATPNIVLNSAPLSISSGMWHHVMVQRQSATFRIFFNGSVVAQGSSTAAISDTGMPLLVGKRNQFDGRHFPVDGRIDEVAIWSRALSDDEIAFLFNSGLGNPVASLGVVRVDIDIKPGSDRNSINPKSRGVIPVAILTTDTFDAKTVDPSTVLFGQTKTSPVQAALEDVDGDGDTDLILHFETPDTGIRCGVTSASLTGETVDRQTIKGSDSVETVGCK